MGKAPSAPDPYETAAAQTQSNEQTANYNAALNRVDTYSPLGQSVYTKTGADSTGAPTYRQDISLSPQEQQLFDTQMTQNNQLNSLANALTGQIGGSLDTPFSDQASSAKDAADAYYAKETAYLDPQFANEQSDLDSKLANQGIVQGSEAYQRAQEEQARDKTFAYNQAQQGAIGAGQTAQEQAIQNEAAVRSQPFNELASIRSASPVQMPSFSGTPQSNAQPTDVAGIINNSYAQQVANSNNFLNGLFSIGGSLGSAAILASDRRLKRDIVRVGTTAVLKLPIYLFRYVWDDIQRLGVMAQDVLRVRPGAVHDMGGWLAVDYGQVC